MVTKLGQFKKLKCREGSRKNSTKMVTKLGQFKKLKRREGSWKNKIFHAQPQNI